MDASIPGTPAELTPEWLTSVLRSRGVVSEASVTGLETEIIGQEWGFTGIVSRVHQVYDRDESGAPRTIVAKFPNAAGDMISTYRETQQRDPVAARRYYERCAREIWFYQQVASESDVPVSRMYYGAVDLDAGAFVLLLEDLGEMRIGDAQYGCSVMDAESVIQGIAPFHARWWATDAFPWVPEWIGDPDDRHERLSQRIGPFLDRFGDRLPDAVRELVVRLQPVYRDVIIELASAPSTLIHADLHLDNVLFDSLGNARIIDWQVITRGPAAWDLAYFLFGSLNTVARRASERELVRGYHEALIAHGIDGYSRGDLWYHLRLSLLCLLAGHVNWFAAVDLNSLAGRELALFNAVIDDGWLFSAALDHDVGALL